MPTRNILVSIGCLSLAVLTTACGDSFEAMGAASGGAGGTNAGGTSAGGTSAGGTNAGGTNAGGTNAGGTNAGGTSTGGTSTGGTSTGGTSTGGTSAGGTGNTLDVPCEEPDALSMSGLWSARLNLVADVQSNGTMLTICPEQQLVEIEMLALLKLDQDPNDATRMSRVELRVCDLVLPTVTSKVGACSVGDTNLAQTVLTVPDALRNQLRNLQPDDVAATLSSLAAGAAIDIERFDFIAGTTAAKLPEWNTSKTGCGILDTSVGRGRICQEACVETCSEMTDDDQDSFPGVTLSLCGRTPDEIDHGVICDAERPALSGATLDGTTWGALKIDPQLAGTVASSCQFGGDVSSSIAYAIVGGDVFLMGAALAVAATIDNQPSFAVRPADSSFAAVRADGQYTAPNLGVTWDDADGSCAALVARRAELFD